MEDRKPFKENSDEMEDSTKNNDDCEDAFQDKSEESGRNPSTLGNQVLPFGQDSCENQQLPSSLSAETSSRSSVPTFQSSSPALYIDLLDEPVSSKDVFCSSLTLRLRTNCSRSVDALLSPRQNLTDSSMPVLVHSGVNSAENIRRGRSALGETRNTDSASPPQPTPDQVTRSFLKARDRQETPPPPLEKQSVEPSMEPTSAKKRRTQTSESDSSKSGAENKSSKLSSSAAARTPDKSLGVQTRQMRAAAQEIESPQSLTRSLTPSKNKRKKIESSCSDSKTANDAFISNLIFPTSAANIDYKSPTNFQTQEREVAERNLGMSESANKGKTSIFFPDYSSDSNSLEQNSNPDDLHQDRSLINFSTNEDGTSMHSNTSTDASSASVNKDSGKRRKGSSASDTWFVQQHDSPEKAPISPTLKRIPSDEASSSKDCKTSMEVEPHEFSLVSSEETKSTSNMTHPATKIKRLESCQSGSTIQNSDLSSSPSRVFDSGIEARGFKTSSSSRVILNPHLSLSSHFPEQSSYSNIDSPYLNVCERKPSTSSHQPVITDGSAGDRCNSSSGVTLSGEEAGRAMISKTSATRISNYASNAQELLLTVFEEMMEFNEEMDQYRELKNLFLSIYEVPSFKTQLYLKGELFAYLMRRRKTFNAQKESRELTVEHTTNQVYEILIRIVVTALDSTASVQSSLSFDIIMDSYKALKDLYEGFSLFWSKNDVKDIKDEASRNRVEFLTNKMNALMLQTRNAFRELLVHIGEHADQSIINSFEEQLFEEDKFYLRRRTF